MVNKRENEEKMKSIERLDSEKWGLPLKWSYFSIWIIYDQLHIIEEFFKSIAVINYKCPKIQWFKTVKNLFIHESVGLLDRSFSQSLAFLCRVHSHSWNQWQVSSGLALRCWLCSRMWAVPSRTAWCPIWSFVFQ